MQLIGSGVITGQRNSMSQGEPGLNLVTRPNLLDPNGYLKITSFASVSDSTWSNSDSYEMSHKTNMVANTTVGRVQLFPTGLGTYRGGYSARVHSDIDKNQFMYHERSLDSYH